MDLLFIFKNNLCERIMITFGAKPFTSFLYEKVIASDNYPEKNVLRAQRTAQLVPENET